MVRRRVTLVFGGDGRGRADDPQVDVVGHREVRERGMNENEIIVDNDEGLPRYSETGEFISSEFNGFNDGGYRYAVTNSVGVTATATWKPEFPEAGWYPVWVWYRHSMNRPADARYEIYHSGGKTTVSISQEVHGQTWRFLGE